MRQALFAALLSLILCATGSQAGTAKKSAKKTAKSAYKRTLHEEEVVKQAEKEFAKAKKAPPPSKHMQDKMQSGM